MAYLAKQRLVFYKKYKVDIWSSFKNTLQAILDKTVYKNGNIVYKLYKTKNILNYHRYWFLKKLKIFFKYKTLYNSKNLKISIFKKKKRKIKVIIINRYIQLVYLLIIMNLWKDVYQLSISNKMQKIIDLFLVKKQQKEKVYFRKPFIYEPRVPFISVKKFKIKKQLIGVQVIKLFYVIYTFRQLSNIAKKAKKQNGVFEHNFLTIIEAKLPSFLYRTSLFSTLFESLTFVKQNNVWINKKFKPLIYYSVKLYDMVGFRIIYKAYLYWNFFKRLRRKAFIFVLPTCFFFSFVFFLIILIRRIQLKDLINTFNFDYYTILSYKK